MAYVNFFCEVDGDGIALVTWNMPDRSMNVFTEEAMDELEKIIEWVASDAAVKGAVITSGKESFSGGADLNMLKKMLGIFHTERARDPDKAIKLLNEWIAKCRALGDNATEDLMTKILVSEEEHLDWIETQLELIRQVGEQNYLSQQIKKES